MKKHKLGKIYQHKTGILVMLVKREVGNRCGQCPFHFGNCGGDPHDGCMGKIECYLADKTAFRRVDESGRFYDYEKKEFVDVEI